MTKRWRLAWGAANKIASCDCEEEGLSFARHPFTAWAGKNEYWHNGVEWHLLVSSLILDGAPAEELP